jgi:putative flippase GtrA
LFAILIYSFSHSTLGVNIVIAQLISHSVAGMTNYLINHFWVFKNDKTKSKGSAFKYFSWWLTQLAVSTSLIGFLGHYTSHPIYAKVLVDFSLFFASYWIQQKLIFKNNNK